MSPSPYWIKSPSKINIVSMMMDALTGKMSCMNIYVSFMFRSHVPSSSALKMSLMRLHIASKRSKVLLTKSGILTFTVRVNHKRLFIHFSSTFRWCALYSLSDQSITSMDVC